MYINDIMILLIKIRFINKGMNKQYSIYSMEYHLLTQFTQATTEMGYKYLLDKVSGTNNNTV